MWCDVYIYIYIFICAEPSQDAQHWDILRPAYTYTSKFVHTHKNVYKHSHAKQKAHNPLTLHSVPATIPPAAGARAEDYSHHEVISDSGSGSDSDSTDSEAAVQEATLTPSPSAWISCLWRHLWFTPTTQVYLIQLAWTRLSICFYSFLRSRQRYRSILSLRYSYDIFCRIASAFQVDFPMFSPNLATLWRKLITSPPAETPPNTNVPLSPWWGYFVRVWIGFVVCSRCMMLVIDNDYRYRWTALA